MNVESMQQVNSSYQSQGSANVAAQAVPAKSGTASTNDMSMQQKAKDAVTITEDGVKTGNVREDGQASNEQIRQAVDTINKNAHNEEAVFGIHEATNRVTIKIVDKDKGSHQGVSTGKDIGYDRQGLGNGGDHGRREKIGGSI